MDEQKKNQEFIIDDTVYETRLTRKFRLRKKYEVPNPKMLGAFIPGIINDIKVTKGQSVKEGECLLILEAMKMKNCVEAPANLRIKDIKIKQGEMVTKNQILIEFE